jgi:hypothetical protein
VKKIILFVLAFGVQAIAIGAVPTEEGLLRNLSNPNLAGKVVTIHLALKNEFIKLIFLMDKPNSIDMLQATYGDSQMQPSQLRDVKFISDLSLAISKETHPERSLFYGTMLMLATNRSVGMEIFLDKNGVKITKNKELINEDKMNLLRSYHSYLANNKGKSESDSPLNPADPTERTKVIALFKSNTYTPSKNIELIKDGDLFLWKADWKSLQGYFTNEERRLKKFNYKNQEGEFIIEASEYTSFNGNNDFPKFIEIKTDKGPEAKIQILSEEVGSKRNLDEYKKKNLPKKDSKDILSFLF